MRAGKGDESEDMNKGTAERKGEREAKAETPVVSADEKDGQLHRTLPTAAWVAIAVVALVVGVLAGHYLLGSSGSISLDGRTTLAASELDSTIATYTFDGQTTAVSAREVLVEANGGADPSANDDGTYDIPTASTVLTYVQNQIILQDAEDRGITASDEDVDEFVEESFGTDLATLASSWGIEEDAAREMVAEAVIMRKLQDSVASTTLPDLPDEPEAPADGEEDEPTAEYAQYIIDLLGDEWDADADTWARTDGSYYATLSSYDISNDSATYAAATAAYGVAASEYQEAYTQISEELGDYSAALLSRATIQLGSLA